MNNDKFANIVNSLLALEIAGNSLIKIGFAVALALAVFYFLRSLMSFLLKKLSALASRTVTSVDDLIAELLSKLSQPVLFILSIGIASFMLNLPQNAVEFIINLILVVLLIQTGIWFNILAKTLIPSYMESNQKDPASQSAIGLISFLARALAWILIALVILDNAGIDITGLVAGLGIGGIAVALALQNVLGDLLSSLSIILDKPFQVGDFIDVGELKGTVQQIGIKTTRLKSLSGEQLIFSNSDLLSSRIRNYKRMYERRVVFNLGVTYQTTKEQLEKIPLIICEVIKSQKDLRFERSHFQGFGDSALNFETVYYVRNSDYNTYMDCLQSINLQLFEKFTTEKIEFAYPTQTLFIEGNK